MIFLLIFLVGTLLINSTVPEETCTLQANKDIKGRDISHRSNTPNKGDCCGHCKQTPGCQGFAWNNFEGGTCWFKNKMEPIVTKIGVSIGAVVDKEADVCSLEDGKDITGGDISHRGNTKKEDCCGLCQQTSGCQSFAWNEFEGGTCWFKSAKGPLVSGTGVSAGINPGGSPTDALVTIGQFKAGVTSNGFPSPTDEQYNAFARTLSVALITTAQEAAMMLANLLQESAGLTAKKEFACIEDGCPNNYRSPGCDAPGQFYFGRGYIQLSWCTNYKPCSMDLFQDDRLVQNPNLVADDEQISWDSASWFWKTNVHNAPGVQAGQFGSTINAINGGLECGGGHEDQARKRYAMYGVVRKEFGLEGPGIENGCYN